MRIFENCTLKLANYFYVDSQSWQYAERIPESNHNIIFVTEGTLYMEIGDRRYAVKENEFLFMPHGSTSRGYRASDSPTGFYHVIFSANRVGELPNHFSVKDTARVRSLYSMVTDISKIKDYDEDMRNGALAVLLYEIAYQRERESKPDSDIAVSIVELMKGYIGSTLHRNISLRDVAHHFGFSAEHTNRLFSREDHITVKAYINKLKIQKIEEYLKSTNISTGAIAKKLGFPNNDALNKYYKYHTGKTIKEYHSRFID